MRRVFITNHQIISPLGFDSETNFKNLKSGKSGIQKLKRANGELFFGSKVDQKKLDDAFSKIGNIDDYTLLEKMMILSVNYILKESKLKLTDKTGLIISTTKGNIDILSPNSKFYNRSERAYLPELGKQIQKFFNFSDEAIILSNACVSGVLAIDVSKNLIQSGLYDEIIVVSGDLISEFILSGFTSFQAISNEPCQPFSKNRKGITIGEAVASVLVTANGDLKSNQKVEILGGASCNDANHISGPSRTGEGLYLSVLAAIKEAGIKKEGIDYISAHGTATLFNDEMESIAFGRLKMLKTPINSLKGYYGHTLGASGLLESIIGIQSLANNLLIKSLGIDTIGVSKQINIIENNEEKELNIFIKTASGFGGCNTAVILKKVN